MAWRLDGIDIAHPYQYRPQPVDWSLVPDLELICHKAGEGTGYTDPMVSQAIPAIEAKGTRYTGAYFWIRPDSDPIAQARHFAGIMHPLGGFPVGRFCQLDIETTTTSKGQALRAVTDDEIRAWVDYVNEFAQRTVVSRYQGRYHPAFYSPLIQDVPLWLPDYSSAPSVPWAIIRQWGGGGNGDTVPGIVSGRVDSNFIHDRSTLDDLCGYPKPAPPPVHHEETAVLGDSELQSNLGPTDTSVSGGLDVTDDDLRKVHDVAFSAMLEVIRSDEYRSLLVTEAHEAAVAVMRSDEFSGLISEAVTSASHQPAS
jgi:GH25 family lysozyme M1 (1,4-beta-N-acetylmuramidase)